MVSKVSDIAYVDEFKHIVKVHDDDDVVNKADKIG